MRHSLTFRAKMSQWLSSTVAHWIVIVAFTALTIWKDNSAYFLGIVFVLILLWARKWEWSFIGLLKPDSWKKVWLKAIYISVALLVLVDMIYTPLLESLLNDRIDISALDGIRGSFLNYIIFIVFMWVVAAFGEEFVYRGLLVERLGSVLGGQKMAMWLAVVISAVLFGVAHRYQGMIGMISTGTVGLIFGILFLKSKDRLWLTILTHGVYDVIGITLIYLDRDQDVYGFIKNLLI